MRLNKVFFQVNWIILTALLFGLWRASSVCRYDTNTDLNLQRSRTNDLRSPTCGRLSSPKSWNRSETIDCWNCWAAPNQYHRLDFYSAVHWAVVQQQRATGSRALGCSCIRFARNNWRFGAEVRLFSKSTGTVSWTFLRTDRVNGCTCILTTQDLQQRSLTHTNRQIRHDCDHPLRTTTERAQWLFRSFGRLCFALAHGGKAW